MKKSSMRTMKLMRASNRNWVFEAEPLKVAAPMTLSEVRDILRLKNTLKRAIERDFAPQDLIEAIRSGIRG